MSKCLVTKLKGSVSNTNLLRIGEMRIHFSKVSNPTDGTQGFGIGVIDKPVILEIIGDGYFTDKNLSENKGKRITLNGGTSGVWLSNNDVDIAVLDKYSLSSLQVYYPSQSSEVHGENKGLQLDSLKYSNSISFLALANTQTSGDIESIKGLTSLTYLNLANTKISGNIESIKNLTSLTYLSLTNVIGDINNLNGLSVVTDLIFNNSSITGDIATLPDTCKLLSLQNNSGEVTWSTRKTSANIIALDGHIRLSNVDDMLKNQAQCQVGFNGSDSTRYKTITVFGKRTSASDDAVQSLQSKGYTISILS